MLNKQFAVPDLKSFGGHIEHQNTDVALVEHLTEQINKTDMSALMDEINDNDNKIDNGNNFLTMPQTEFTEIDEDGNSVYCVSDDDTDSEEGTQLLDISGIKLLWTNKYSWMNINLMVEQCMT